MPFRSKPNSVRETGPMLWHVHAWELTHWGRVTHICVSKLTIIGSDNGLSLGRHQAIIRTNAGILLIRPLGTNFSEFLVEILIFSFKKMRLKVSSAKRRPFCLGLNVLNTLPLEEFTVPYCEPGWQCTLHQYSEHFLEWKCMVFDQYSIKAWSYRSDGH